MNSSDTQASGSMLDSLSNLGGQGIVTVGLGIIVSSISMIISAALIGFWMSVLLWLIGMVLSLLTALCTPLILESISDETYVAIGNKASSAIGWVTGLFSSNDEPAVAAA